MREGPGRAAQRLHLGRPLKDATRGNQPLLSSFLREHPWPQPFPEPVLWKNQLPPGPRRRTQGRRQDLPAALKPKPAGTGECSASSSRITTSDTLIGQALAGTGPGGLRRGWETSLEAERPGAGSAAAFSAAAAAAAARATLSHNNLHFRLPATVADPQGYACAEYRARRLAEVEVSPSPLGRDL